MKGEGLDTFPFHYNVKNNIAEIYANFHEMVMCILEKIKSYCIVFIMKIVVQLKEDQIRYLFC